MSEPSMSTPDNPFSDTELRQFDVDDAVAGSAIGKLLTLFFLYTVVAMVGSCIATWLWVVKSTASS